MLISPFAPICTSNILAPKPFSLLARDFSLCYHRLAAPGRSRWLLAEKDPRRRSGSAEGSTCASRDHLVCDRPRDSLRRSGYGRAFILQFDPDNANEQATSLRPFSHLVSHLRTEQVSENLVGRTG